VALDFLKQVLLCQTTDKVTFSPKSCFIFTTQAFKENYATAYF